VGHYSNLDFNKIPSTFAIAIMATKGIGNLIVTEYLTRPVGILTERELVEYLSLNGRIPNQPLKDVLVYQSY
jgi:CBS domain-containing protein